MDEEQFYAGVREFLAELGESAGQDGGQQIGADDNLFDLGLVNSFTIIRLIVFLEEHAGVEIDLAAHDLETFYTLRGLYSLVSQDAAAAEEARR